MDVKAELLIKGMPDDTYVEAVSLDRHPQDIAVTATTWAASKTMFVNAIVDGLKAAVKPAGPLYAISDLHMGDGGPRDNFAYGTHEKELLAFLDMVETNRGRLIICGDLFELWQSNISKVLTKREWLLDRLAWMKAIYVLGNHDADLYYFIGKAGWLDHPFFQTMRQEHTEQIGGRWFHFIHGHQADPYCSGDNPGLGRITAIYSGLAEDRNGSPMLDKYRTVEDKVVGRLEKLVSLWNRLRGKPDRFTEINRTLRNLLYAADNGYAGHDVIVCGHTHFPGRIGNWHYNPGTWAERVNSFLCVNQNGTVGVFDWTECRAVPNPTELPI
jgi:UDP-2,3-diacylglucosamine pyrophosphatase LpxH